MVWSFSEAARGALRRSVFVVVSVDVLTSAVKLEK